MVENQPEVKSAPKSFQWQAENNHKPFLLMDVLKNKTVKILDDAIEQSRKKELDKSHEYLQNKLINLISYQLALLNDPSRSKQVLDRAYKANFQGRRQEVNNDVQQQIQEYKKAQNLKKEKVNVAQEESKNSVNNKQQPSEKMVYQKKDSNSSGISQLLDKLQDKLDEFERLQLKEKKVLQLRDQCSPEVLQSILASLNMGQAQSEQVQAIKNNLQQDMNAKILKIDQSIKDKKEKVDKTLVQVKSLIHSQLNHMIQVVKNLSQASDYPVKQQNVPKKNAQKVQEQKVSQSKANPVQNKPKAQSVVQEKPKQGGQKKKGNKKNNPQVSELANDQNSTSQPQDRLFDFD